MTTDDRDPADAAVPEADIAVPAPAGTAPGSPSPTASTPTDAASTDAATGHADPAETAPPEAAPSGAPAIPGQRIVSGDEFLDADPAVPERAPLFRIPAVSGTPRGRRIARVVAAALAVVGVAGAAGAVTHSTDVHHAAGELRDRPMLRLIGGDATLAYPQETGSFSGKLGTDLQISVRNDGQLPQTITSVALAAPGVTVTRQPKPTTVRPGTTEAVDMGVAVDCDSRDLVDRPRSVTLQMYAALPSVSMTPTTRTGTTDSTLPPETQASLAAAADEKPTGRTGSVTLPMAGATAQPGGGISTAGFFRLCGVAELSENSPSTSYSKVLTPATAAKPSFTVQFDVRGTGDRPGLLTVADDELLSGFPGLEFTGGVPSAATPLSLGTPVPATLTVRVTDCGTLKRVLTANGGVSALMDATSQLPLGTEAADPRFRGDFMTQPLMLDDGLAEFEHDLLLNLLAACPGLK